MSALPEPSFKAFTTPFIGGALRELKPALGTDGARAYLSPRGARNTPVRVHGGGMCAESAIGIGAGVNPSVDNVVNLAR